MLTHDLENQLRHALAACPSEIPLGAIDDVPLAFNVPLPDYPFGNGHISIRFEQLALRALDECAIACTGTAATVRWPRATLSGTYAVSAVAAPKVALDTGGTMFDDESDAIEPGGGDATDAPLDPADRNAMLDNARAQRTRLMDDPNGQALMSQYDEHDEIYNTVFVSSAAARGAWAARGATKEMALDTHQAVNANGVVNDPTRTYGTANVTYNENAFNQQLQIVVNTIAADPDFDPFDPDAKLDPDSPYTKASLAALTFGNAVGQTGNTKSNAAPLARDAIYDAVKTGSQPAPSTIDELQNVLDQGIAKGGAAAEASARGWRVLDEEDRARVRRYLRAAAEHRAEQLARPRRALWTGACGAELLDLEAELDFEPAAGGRLQLAACRVRLPAFAFHIADAAWDGEAAAIARQRLERLYFIRSRVQDHVQTGLVRFLTARLARGAGQ